MKPSLFKTTLCTLLFAATISGASAQKKSLPSLSSVAKAGFSLSSHLNPILSVGAGIGSDANYRGTNFSLAGEAGMFIGKIPFRQYSQEFEISETWPDKKNVVESSVVPISNYLLSFSYGPVSFGGGIILVNKNGNVLSQQYSTPNVFSNNADNYYEILELGYVFKTGVDINPIFSKLKNPLYLEFIGNYIPKSKNLPEEIIPGDKNLFPVSFGFMGEFRGSKR